MSSNGKQRVEQTRTPKFAYFQGPQPQTQIQVLDGDSGLQRRSPRALASRVGTAAERDRRTDLFHHPLTLCIAATVPLTTVSNVRTVGQRPPGGHRVSRIAQCDDDHRRRRPPVVDLVARHTNANLGDVVMTTTFADYQDVNGLKLPAKISGKVDDFTT